MMNRRLRHIHHYHFGTSVTDGHDGRPRIRTQIRRYRYSNSNIVSTKIDISGRESLLRYLFNSFHNILVCILYMILNRPVA